MHIDFKAIRTIGGKASAGFEELVCQLAGLEPRPKGAELCMNLGDVLHQAARLSVSLVTSTPSLNLIPSMTFGN